MELAQTRTRVLVLVWSGLFCTRTCSAQEISLCMLNSLQSERTRAHGVGEVARECVGEEALAQLPVVRVAAVDEHVELAAVTRVK